MAIIRSQLETGNLTDRLEAAAEERTMSGTTEPRPGPNNARLNAPNFSGSDLQILGSSNVFTIVVGQPHPQISEDGGVQTFGFVIEAQVVLNISPQTAKDLVLLLSEHLTQHESIYGTIETALTKARGAV